MMILCSTDGNVKFRLAKNMKLLMSCYFLAVFSVFVFWAQDHSVRADIYLVKDVKVDAKSKTASQAKIKAMRQGQVLAFKQLMNRLSSSAEAQTLLKLPATEIGRLVRGMSVVDERIGENRYIANLNISFQPAAIRSLLQQFSIPFTDKQATPLLILPVFVENGRAILWDEPNPLRTAWGNIDSDAFLMPARLPNGEIEDIQAISADEALEGDAKGLAAIKARYKVSEVLVFVGKFNKNNNRLRLTLSGPTPVGDIELDKSYSATPENVIEVAEKAAQSFMENLENRWKGSARTGPELAGERFLVTVPFASFRQWKNIRARITDTEGVLRLDVRALSQRGAVIYLTFSGEYFELEERLSYQGLFMRDMGDGWVLTADN